METSAKIQEFLEKFSRVKGWYMDSRGAIRIKWWNGETLCPVERLIQGGGDPSIWGDKLGYTGTDILTIMWAADNFPSVPNSEREVVEHVRESMVNISGLFRRGTKNLGQQISPEGPED
jgi:hypothetical protein